MLAAIRIYALNACDADKNALRIAFCRLAAVVRVPSGLWAVRV